MTLDTSNRQRAVDEGLQKDVSAISREVGLFLPVFITNKVMRTWIIGERNDSDLSEAQRNIIKVILGKLVYSLRVHRQTSKSNLIYFSTSIEKDGANETVLLLSLLGPIDSSDRRPCITIMLPEEYPARSDEK